MSILAQDLVAVNIKSDKKPPAHHKMMRGRLPCYFLNPSFSATARLKTRCSGVLSRLSTQK